MALIQPTGLPERIPALNVDVFRAILHFCAATDLMLVGYASRLLRKEAVKELLTRPVHLQGNVQIESFCHFMLAGDPSRFSYLQILVINHALYTQYAPSAYNLLAEVVSRATQLRKLYLRRCEGVFLQGDARFVDAIAQLEHLRLLQIWMIPGFDYHVRLMLLRLRSALKTLDVSDQADNRLGEDFPNALVACQPQLEKLHICYPNLASSEWQPFHALRKLTLSINDKVISLQHISRTFPNLRELLIFALGFDADLLNPSDETVRTRNASLALQADGGGWKSLDYLFGSIGDVYTLCLTCPVRRMGLGHYEAKLHQAYLDVISRTRPRRVDMSIYCSTWLQTHILAGPSLFVYGGESSNPGAVSHMCLNVSVSATDAVTTRLLTDTISPFLATCRLEYLHVWIGEFFTIRDEDDYLHASLPVDPRLQKLMAELDIAVLVSALATSGPFLRTIVLSPSSRERTVWTVDRGDERQILRRLDPYTGSQVVEREEM